MLNCACATRCAWFSRIELQCRHRCSSSDTGAAVDAYSWAGSGPSTFAGCLQLQHAVEACDVHLVPPMKHPLVVGGWRPAPIGTALLLHLTEGLASCIVGPLLYGVTCQWQPPGCHMLARNLSTGGKVRFRKCPARCHRCEVTGVSSCEVCTSSGSSCQGRTRLNARIWRW
jgi:hypothetical protein